jgi:crotonobetainyl-CoA:carnitine CoA-transferase CaiB-like acyl-CoA transferase
MLEGIKVLDLTRVLAGPLATMLLGDLGADVIKVERPGTGDETRTWGPPFDAEGRSAYYLSINRNKLSIAADIDKPADRDLIAALISEADVVVDNFRAPVLERRGLSPEQFVRDRPSLTWCTITGFGAGSDRPGYDFVTQAECGWMAITGEANGNPMKVGVALADVIAGQDATIAILAALIGKYRTGEGRRIVISLVDSARAALVNVAQNALVSGRDAKRWGNAHPNLVPYQLFQTVDRPIVVAVGSDAQWVACARALGLDELAADPSVGTNPQRLEKRDWVVGEIQRRLATAPAGVWQAKLDAAGIPNGLVKTVLEAIQETNASPLTGMPSAVGGKARFAPPRLNQHGELIRERGWEAFSQASVLPG